jgi:hypothetical protein
VRKQHVGGMGFVQLVSPADTPTGSVVAMKDGWLAGPDGLWVANSVGIVSGGQETYIIAVYMQHDATLDEGWAIYEPICAAIASLLA